VPCACLHCHLRKDCNVLQEYPWSTEASLKQVYFSQYLSFLAQKLHTLGDTWICMCVDVLDPVAFLVGVSTYHNHDVLQMYQLVHQLKERARPAIKMMLLKLAKDKDTQDVTFRRYVM
jgi:hypothetical protein